MCKNGQTWQAIQDQYRQGEMADSEGEILTLEEVAAFLRAGKRTVYRFAQRGEIPAFKVGGTWRFRRPEPERWIDQNSNQQHAAGRRDYRGRNSKTAPHPHTRMTS